MEKRYSNTNYESAERLVSGYACTFETESDGLNFVEVIHRGAITEETIKNSDIFAKFNHDDSKVLARCKHGEGSLILEVDERGLKYTFEAPKTALGDELLEYLERGDLNQSSFAFTVPEGGDKWCKRDGVIYRDIYVIDKLYDVSPVFQPAYSATECSKRGEDMVNTSKEIDSILDAELQTIKDLM